MRVQHPILVLILCAACTTAAAESPYYTKTDTWAQSMVASRAALEAAQLSGEARATAGVAVWDAFQRDYPLQWDWCLQDGGLEIGRSLACDPAVVARMQARVLEEAPQCADAFVGTSPGTRAWFDAYETACQARREHRLEPVTALSGPVVFTKHFNLGGSHYAYTEAQTDAQRERNYQPGGALCILEIDPGHVSVRTLLEDADGVIRDPNVSYDGSRILFSWKMSDKGDDYHLYEYDVATERVRQLTAGPGFADYEGAYLPDSDIVFNSTRCVQTVDCWWTEVSNLYRCDADGNHIRRLSFDQVHTNYPTVAADGRLFYTRWEYSDRGQVYVQSLFQMNPDGSGQTEFYGNNSWFPTTILHARAVPDSQTVMAVASGHHTRQAGKLIRLDRRHGNQEAAGVTMLAPERPAKAVRVDQYGQKGELFQYPWPLSEDLCLVGYSPYGWARGGLFKVYAMYTDGRRELLAADPKTSCSQPVPLTTRPIPHVRPVLADYAKDSGVYFVQDVYRGPGLEGVPRGTIKELRVVALDFRAAGVGDNRNNGPAGGALISTPPAIGNGAWDPKIVLGHATVHEDGSACFRVPARTPVYFQLLDEKRRAVQTMRSWSTLQPGESFSCVGCHEDKREAPPAGAKMPMALVKGPQDLAPFHGPARGFSFAKEVQPILDRHCVRCHKGGRTTPSASHAYPGDSVEALTDGKAPVYSYEKGRRFSWFPHKGTVEWVQVTFPDPVRVESTSVFWFDDTGGGGGCRVPASWRLLYRDGDGWTEVSNASGYGVGLHRFNDTRFDVVETTALRIEAQLADAYSAGIHEWRLDAEKLAPFSLMATPVLDAQAKRFWSRAYLNLTHSGHATDVVNWINAQSEPTMLPPYHAGAATSRLLTMLEKGHSDVALDPADLDKIACWIDLLVPFCGDYIEANAWTDEEKAFYQRFLEKRQRMERQEQATISRLLANASR
ncbi:MAG: hypothetical protein GY851_36685 [bacterium]|nr:hypothetical protein [bacterium]